jgi:hypothetical protein
MDRKVQVTCEQERLPMVLLAKEDGNGTEGVRI